MPREAIFEIKFKADRHFKSWIFCQRLATLQYSARVMVRLAMTILNCPLFGLWACTKDGTDFFVIGDTIVDFPYVKALYPNPHVDYVPSLANILRPKVVNIQA